MGWYQVTKRINGRFYLYWQKTYQLNGRVKTLNQYVGPVVAKTPPTRSLAAQMENLPEAHKKLRAEFDAGKITKVEYLEAITSKPDPNLAYHEALGTEEPQALIRRALRDEPNNALWKLNPYYNPERVDLRQYKKVLAQERRDDESIQYGNLKARATPKILGCETQDARCQGSQSFHRSGYQTQIAASGSAGRRRTAN